jgi:hypothetical protein
MKQYKNIEVATVDELKTRIETNTRISEMDDLRYACVKYMNNGHPEVLKLWQDKYWALKRCPTCGKLRG